MLSDYFTKEDIFVFCKNVKGLLTAMGVPQYKPCEWRVFIDSSKQSLKCILLHNASTYAGVPIGHSETLKESYSTVQMVLQKLCYNEHKWAINGQHFVGTANRLCKVPVLSLSLGQ